MAEGGSYWSRMPLSEKVLAVIVAAFGLFCIGFLVIAAREVSGPTAGRPCEELTAAQGELHRYESVLHFRDRVQGVLVSAIYGEDGPRERCAMMMGRHRCEVSGPTIVRSEVRGARRYFDVPAGENAVVLVRRKVPTCILLDEVAAE